VNRTWQRRQGSHHAGPDAAERQGDLTTGPTDVEALMALRTLRAWLGVSVASAVYTQHDLPPDAESADSYKRRHRRLRKAGRPGVWVRGKLLCCTPHAWASDLPKSPRKPTLTIVPTPAVDPIDQALGIRTRGGR
jgi:hypothetical protein